MVEPKPHLTPAFPSVVIKVGDTNLGVIPSFLQTFEHQMFVDQRMGLLTARFFDPAYDLVEDALISAKDDVTFQYGWVDGPASDVRVGQLVKFGPRFEDRGAYLTVSATDQSVRMTQKAQAASHRGRISEIATRLIERHGLTAEVEETADEAAVYQQNNLTDFGFIDTILKPRAKSASGGRSGYELRPDGDTIYFRPPQYNGVFRRYLFARDRMGEVISFAPNYNGQAMLQSGGGMIRVEGWDPKTKQRVVRNVSLQEPAPRVKQAEETVETPDVPGAYGRYYAIPLRRKGDVDAWAEDKWSRARLHGWTATSDVMGDPQLVPGDLLEFIVLKRDGERHYTSGVYRAVRVAHKIEAGSFVTSLELVTDGSMRDVVDNSGSELPDQDAAPRGDFSTIVESEPVGLV